VQSSPGFAQKMNASLPDVDTFITNLGNVRQARPQLAAYPKISQILGDMIVSVLLGKSQPQAALAAAAQQVNQVLASGSSS
jgi:multiple sugar transport system substrate-binding protein